MRGTICLPLLMAWGCSAATNSGAVPNPPIYWLDGGLELGETSGRALDAGSLRHIGPRTDHAIKTGDGSTGPGHAQQNRDAQPDQDPPSGLDDARQDHDTPSSPRCAVPPTVQAVGRRGGDAPSLLRTHYDYAPTIMHDGVYRMWWCAGVAGDHILYSEAEQLSGPWSTPTVVFAPAPQGFDNKHVCDPSVVRVRGTYYMYYGGLEVSDGGQAPFGTAIGVATSPDGIHWTRVNGGQPIVWPYRWPPQRLPDRADCGDNVYGAGQPSVLYLDGHFYMTYTDTSAQGGNRCNGAGQYVLRSPDPTFQEEVEELQQGGFRPYSTQAHTSFSLIEAFSVDWQFSDALDMFVLADVVGFGDQPGVRLNFYDRKLRSLQGQVRIPAQWTEGPGIVSRPDKHAIPGSCNSVPVDIMRPVSPTPADIPSWDLSHVGTRIETNLPCDCVDQSAVYEGSFMMAPQLPLALVVGGKRLQFASFQPANLLARSGFEVTPETYHSVPFGGSLFTKAPVYGAQGRPAGFLIDGTVWPVGCAEVITANESVISSVSAEEWDAYPKGPDLFCLK